MNRKSLGCVFRLLLCALLCMTMVVPLTGTALAFDGSGEEQNITIRITPPSGLTQGSAAVEICVTDNAGTGFQSAQAKAGGGNWRDVTGQLEQTGNCWYCVEDITENCTVQVRVIGPDGIVYEKSEYIQCFSTTADHQSPAAFTASGTNAATPSSASQSLAPITPPGGQGTVIDNVSGTSEDSGREFFTIATPDENVFYLVIDRKKDMENVYFLNAVTEADLMALTEKDTDTPSQSAIPDPEPVCSCREKCAPGEVNVNCPVCGLSWKDCAGTIIADPVDPEPEQPKDSGGAGTTILVLAAAAAVGAAGWYLKIYKPKKELADAEDFDDLTGIGDENTVNEDDLPAPGQGSETYLEPDEPQYPGDYGDDL